MSFTQVAGGVIAATAISSISSHRAIAIVDDVPVYADHLTPEHLGRVRGISTNAATEGDPVYVQFLGRLSDPSFSFTPGPVFVGVNGVLSQTPPTSGWLQQVAFAETPTLLTISVLPPIDLG